MGTPWGEIAGAAGQTVNNRMQQAIDMYQFFKSIGDTEKMDKAIAQFRNIPNLDPKQLQYAADLMGVQPDVLTGRQRTDQIGALRRLQDIADKGGMDEQSIAANQQAGAQAARQNQANQAAIQSKMQMRGMNPGSGSNIASQQQAAQSGYNTVAMAGTQNAADARMRALQAIRESGRLSGDIASSQQALALANQRARSQRDRYNSGVRNAASQFNSNAMLNTANYNRDLAAKKIDPSQGATERLRNEQTGYVRDFGNRQQLQGQQLGNLGGGMFGGKK